jgi:chitinase
MTTAVPAPAPAAPERTMRLSKRRVALAIVMVLAVVAAGVWWVRGTILTVTEAPTAAPWFASYVDLTLTPRTAFETPVEKSRKNVVLGFVVADPADACAPSWGASYSMDEAAVELDLDRRIAALEQRGGEALVSFGGQANSELALACTDQSKLQAAYASVIDRYSLTTIDLDIEGSSLSPAANERRATAIAALQKAARAAHRDLAVWLTIPVTPAGMAENGTDTVATFLAAGVDLAGVNLMTMDYGQSLPEGTSMLEGSIDALSQAHRQLGILYSNAGTTLTDKTLWSKIGATPMIGQNDVPAEVFTLDDAKALNTWARSIGITRISMWSLNRDQTCGTSYTDLSHVSDVCSGVDQGDLTFTATLGSKLTGSPSANTSTTTTAEPIPADIPDDPATSPYQIWSEDATYLAGTKVVWHHNVYEAKWWTSGDLPDDAVLDTYQTPWTLIGPVMPGETPIPLPTLPPGTYDSWSGTKVYTAGDRVMLAGIPFEAKWWTTGDSPENSGTDPDNSPWTPLTAEQIQKVLDAQEAQK